MKTDNLPVSNALQTSSVHKIPVRATIVSVLSAVPYVLFFTVAYLFNLDSDQIGIWSHLVMQLMGAFRCPTIGVVKNDSKSMYIKNTKD